jgi:parvulin-like peptidyl-prolyl isomerase
MRGAQQYAAAQSPDSEITQVGHVTEGVLPMTAVVARVNGTPILAGDVLEELIPKLVQIRVQIEQASKKYPQQIPNPDAKFREVQDQAIQHHLPKLIEQTILVDAMKAKMKKEQLEQIETQLDKFFESEVEKMKAQAGVGTIADLEAMIQSQGGSLATMRKNFGDNQLALEFVRMQLPDAEQPTRAELLAAYEARKAEFEVAAAVKWQQLQISVQKHGADKAQERMQQALQDLQNGDEFGTVVRRYSDAPTAQDGGQWDWMQSESIALPQLKQAIETLPVGQVSNVIDTKTHLQLVMVNGRRPHGYKPFDEVQEEISKQITDSARETAAKKVIQDLKDKAIIETIYDDMAATTSSVDETGRKQL